MKRQISIVLVCLILCALIPVPAAAASELSVGQTVSMGSYEQDGNTSNGAEPISWIVLDVHGDKALLISQYCLDAAQFHSKQTAVTWETCNLRKWLNETFLNKAFTATESAQILDTKISTPKSAYGNKSGGNDTTDKIFCLSSDEANTYFSSDADRKGTLTKYASGRTSYNWWWTRSPGGETDAAKAIVNGNGAVTTGGNWVDNNDSVRPAMWISTDKKSTDSASAGTTAPSTGSPTGLTKFSEGEYGLWVTEGNSDRFYQQATLAKGNSFWIVYSICVDDTELPSYKFYIYKGMQSTGDHFYKPDKWKGDYADIPISISRCTSLVDGSYRHASVDGNEWTCTITKSDGNTIEGIIEGTFCKGTYGEFRFLRTDPKGLLNTFHAKTVWDRYWGIYEDSGSGSDTGFDDSQATSTTAKTNNPRDCGVCGGNGKCRTCSGTGLRPCGGCSGSGRCRTCNGKGGKIQNKKWTDCYTCGGSGKCSTCRGAGKNPCSICHGDTYCNACGGSGKSRIS